MRTKAKKEIRKRRQASPRRGSAKGTRAEGGLVSRKRQFAKMIWPRIKDSTKFIELPEFQTTVTYKLRSGNSHTASLNWYGVSHGSKILGHYDDENDVCYIGKFVE